MQPQLVNDLRNRVAHLRSSQLKSIAGGRQVITDKHSVAPKFRRYAQRLKQFVLSCPKLFILLKEPAEVIRKI